MIIDIVRTAVSSIAAHGLRSVLTTLGIVIGVTSVIATVALMQGLIDSVRKQFEGLGTNVLSVKADTSFEDALRGKINRLSFEDVEKVRFHAEGIESVTPFLVLSGRASVEARNGRESSIPIVFGTTSSYQDVQRSYTRRGRFLSETDDAARRRVCVIGEKLRKELRLPENPVGHFIEFGREWFRIVGVMEPRGEVFGFDQDNFAVIPYQTALSLIGRDVRPDLQIHFRVMEFGEISIVKDRIRRLLRQAHRLDPSDKDDFKIESAQQIATTFNDVTNTITAAVAGIVGISLLVGGIGIMNIMLVSVTERTREIGISKALGARRRDILLQFLIEAVLLALAGGLVGVLLGYALAHSIAMMIPSLSGVSIPWGAALLAMGFSGVVGIVFGVVPAAKAANLDPIEALRYE